MATFNIANITAENSYLSKSVITVKGADETKRFAVYTLNYCGGRYYTNGRSFYLPAGLNIKQIAKILGTSLEVRKGTNTVISAHAAQYSDRLICTAILEISPACDTIACTFANEAAEVEAAAAEAEAAEQVAAEQPRAAVVTYANGVRFDGELIGEICSECGTHTAYVYINGLEESLGNKKSRKAAAAAVAQAYVLMQLADSIVEACNAAYMAMQAAPAIMPVYPLLHTQQTLAAQYQRKAAEKAVAAVQNLPLMFSEAAVKIDSYLRRAAQELRQAIQAEPKNADEAHDIYESIESIEAEAEAQFAEAEAVMATLLAQVDERFMQVIRDARDASVDASKSLELLDSYENNHESQILTK